MPRTVGWRFWSRRVGAGRVSGAGGGPGRGTGLSCRTGGNRVRGHRFDDGGGGAHAGRSGGRVGGAAVREPPLIRVACLSRFLCGGGAAMQTAVGGRATRRASPAAHAPDTRGCLP